MLDFIDSFKERSRILVAKIENSDLVLVNKGLYNDLISMIRDLNLKIVEYQERNGNVTRDDLSDLISSIEALFEFYMREGGSQKIASLHIEQVRSHLSAIVNKVNVDNYCEVDAEFDETIKHYRRVLTAAANSFTIEDLINNFKYQIFKYRIGDNIFDDTIDARVYLSFIIRDINSLISDPKVCDELRCELKKYSLDAEMVADNVFKVMILINLGFNNKTVSKEQILDAYQKTYYKKSDLEKRYDGHKIESTRKVTKIRTDKICQNGKYILKDIRSYMMDELALILIKLFGISGWSGDNTSVSTIIDEIKDYFAEDLQYLIEVLAMQVNVVYFLAFREAFKADYEFDCAVYAQREELTPYFISEYIIATDNSLLIDYIIKSDEVAYFTDELKKHAIETQNATLLKGFIKHDLIDYGTYKELDAELQIMIIDNRLKECESVEAKLEVLKNFYKGDVGENLDVERFIVRVLLSFNNKDYIIDFLTYILKNLYNCQNEFFFVVEEISDESLKNEILDYFYQKCKSYNEIAKELLSITILNVQARSQSFSLKGQETDIDNYNIFEAGFVSSIIGSDIPYFIFKHGNNPYINWEYIMSKTNVNDKDPDFGVVKACYENKRDYFKENILPNCNSEVAFRMIREVPSSIIDFVYLLDDNKILELSSEALEYLCRVYEENLQKSGLDIRSFMEKCKSKKFLSFKGCLVFIMYRGLLTDELMNRLNFLMLEPVSNKPNISKPSYSFLLLVEAIKRSKNGYLRPMMVNIALNGTECAELPYEIMFMSEQEIESLKNNENESLEIRNLKLRKYYGDLIKMLNVVPWSRRTKIIKEIVKSGIEEYIMFVSSNYPEYRELILAGISDPEIYKKVIGFDGTLSIDEALRVAMLEEGTIRK